MFTRVLLHLRAPSLCKCWLDCPALPCPEHVCLPLMRVEQPCRLLHENEVWM